MWAKKNEEEVKAHKRFIKEFGAIALNNPKPEHKYEIPYNDLFLLVIQPDCVDESTLYENKTGKTSLSSYLSSPQLALYYLGLSMINHSISVIKLIHYNQYDNLTTWGIKHPGEYLLLEGRNYIDSIAPEIYEHFKNLKIL